MGERDLVGAGAGRAADEAIIQQLEFLHDQQRDEARRAGYDSPGTAAYHNGKAAAFRTALEIVRGERRIATGGEWDV